MKSIRNIAGHVLVAFLALSASVAHGADLTGRWVGEGERQDRIIEFTKDGKIIFYEEGVAGISGTYKKLGKSIRITIKQSEIGEAPPGMQFEWVILKQAHDKLMITDERKQPGTLVRTGPNK